jgi:hypothetical protein
MHFVVSWNPIHQPIGTAVSDSRTLLPCVMSSASHGKFPIQRTSAEAKIIKYIVTRKTDHLY